VARATEINDEEADRHQKARKGDEGNSRAWPAATAASGVRILCDPVGSFVMRKSKSDGQLPLDSQYARIRTGSS
jgi:hypothetical protein